VSALAPWIERQARALLGQRGHALLLTGPAGLGQFELALALASAWLCEAPGRAPQDLACGHCPSCHAIAVHTHADLRLLLPEAEALARDIPLDEQTQKDLEKRKPSREIKVDAMRAALEFAQRTSGRGRGKVVVVFPADRMNAVSANALLKTLEEPEGGLRFVLAANASERLLPTIRSRCTAHGLAWPRDGEALDWLRGELPAASEADRQTLLRAAGGRPLAALALARQGVDAALWRKLPALARRGDAAALQAWAPPVLLDALQKLAHDLSCRAVDAAPRYFAPEDLAALKPLPALSDLTGWATRLRLATATAEHPFSAGLMLEALLTEASRTLGASSAAERPRAERP